MIVVQILVQIGQIIGVLPVIIPRRIIVAVWFDCLGHRYWGQCHGAEAPENCAAVHRYKEDPVLRIHDDLDVKAAAGRAGRRAGEAPWDIITGSKTCRRESPLRSDRRLLP